MRAAGALQRLGIGDGDTVALMMRNSPTVLELMLACRWLGATWCPINWHFKHDELRHILGDCGAKLFVADAPLLRELHAAVPPEPARDPGAGRRRQRQNQRVGRRGRRPVAALGAVARRGATLQRCGAHAAWADAVHVGHHRAAQGHPPPCRHARTGRAHGGEVAAVLRHRAGHARAAQRADVPQRAECLRDRRDADRQTPRCCWSSASMPNARCS